METLREDKLMLRSLHVKQDTLFAIHCFSASV